MFIVSKPVSNKTHAVKKKNMSMLVSKCCWCKIYHILQSVKKWLLFGLVDVSKKKRKNERQNL